MGNHGTAQGGTTARILVGNGADPEAWRFLHDQILMDIAPQANEGNENIDGTKIYSIRTPLARWMEESVVLDGPYVHDTVLALKSKITEPLEKQYETELQVVLAKKAKDDEERKKRSEEKARQETERAQAAATAAAALGAVTSTGASATTADQTVTDATSATTEPVVSAPTSLDEIEHVNDIAMTSPEQQRPPQLSPLLRTGPDVISIPLRPTHETMVPLVQQVVGTGTTRIAELLVHP